MRNDPPEDGANRFGLADLCAIAEAPHGDAARPSAEDAPALGAGGDGQAADAGAADLLGEIGDTLIVAYRLAVQDGDPTTVTLIRQALLHTGRRLARGMSPAEAGLSCH